MEEKPDILIFLLLAGQGLVGIVVWLIWRFRERRGGELPKLGTGLEVGTIVGFIAMGTVLMLVIAPVRAQVVSPEGLIFVLFGTMAAMLVAYPLGDVVGLAPIVMCALTPPGELSRLAMRQWPEAHLRYRDLDEPLLDAAGRQDLARRLELGFRMLHDAGRFGAISGIIGALCLGLGASLRPSPPVTVPWVVALLPLVYGAVLWGWVCTPLASKLARQRQILLQLDPDNAEEVCP